MPRHNPTREWVMSRPPGSCFRAADVPGPSTTVAAALSRLASPDGPIERVRQGVYWRKSPSTRFGEARPSPSQVALFAAGDGSGLAGYSATNSLGLSTQVPRRTQIAVVGRAPKGLSGVSIVTRSNPYRVLLAVDEVSVLESLRDFDRCADIEWPQARLRLRRMAASGRIDLDKVASVATHERSAGLRDRITDLISG